MNSIFVRGASHELYHLCDYQPLSLSHSLSWLCSKYEGLRVYVRKKRPKAFMDSKTITMIIHVLLSLSDDCLQLQQSPTLCSSFHADRPSTRRGFSPYIHLTKTLYQILASLVLRAPIVVREVVFKRCAGQLLPKRADVAHEKYKNRFRPRFAVHHTFEQLDHSLHCVDTRQHLIVA